MDPKEKKVMSLITELTKELTGYVPIELPLSSNATQRHGIAKMYAEKGSRDYLQELLKRQRDAIADAEDLKGIWVQKGRILAIAEILRASKQMFDEAQKLDNAILRKGELA